MERLHPRHWIRDTRHCRIDITLEIDGKELYDLLRYDVIPRLQDFRGRLSAVVATCHGEKSESSSRPTALVELVRVG